jgi:ArsR family transcriptional regulator, arsenate/arsenite/antimonite-responsive transcriptional repressor / arsenate reductase (thioredoxin)
MLASVAGRAGPPAVRARPAWRFRLTLPTLSAIIESMSTEQSLGWVDLDRRARIHAALADPARLRIVDHLSCGDASPTELQALLGMASNLFAHHLHVLDRAGLITRHRSEADRRRTYLRLVADALSGLLSQGVTPVRRVVFVCTANSARSQLAAALWAGSSTVPAASAGTHPAARIAPGAVATARRHGLKLAGTHPQRVADILTPDDYLVTVCDSAHEELHAQATGPDPARALHWSVPDPVRAGTDAAFDAAYDDLANRVVNLAPRLTAF